MLAGSSFDPNLALIAKPAQQKADATEYQNHFCLKVFTPRLPILATLCEACQRDCAAVSRQSKNVLREQSRNALLTDISLESSHRVGAGSSRLPRTGFPLGCGWRLKLMVTDLGLERGLWNRR